MSVLPLTTEQTTEYNNVATTPPTAPLGDIINDLNNNSTAIYAPTGPPLDLYFATTGSDTTGDGTLAAPYATLPRVLQDLPTTIARVVTIHALPGLYTGQQAVRIFEIFTNGKVTVVGEPTAAFDTTVVSSVATADPLVVDVNIGAFGIPFTQGDLVLKVVFPGFHIYLPVVATASPVVSVLAPSFFTFVLTPGTEVHLQQLGVTFEAFIIALPFVSLDSVKLTQETGPSFISGAEFGSMVAEGCAVDGTAAAIFVESAFTTWDGCHINAAPTFFDYVIDGASLQFVRTQFWTATRVRTSINNQVDLSIQDIRHEVALSSGALAKITVDGGKITTAGTIETAGAGTVLGVTGGAHVTLQNDFVDTGGTTTLLAVNDGSITNTTFGSASGALAGNAVTVHNGSQALGVSAYAGITSTPVGDDVVVGGNAAVAFAALPDTDLVLGSASEICRAT